MIAPRRQTDSDTARAGWRLRRARQIVASAFFEKHPQLAGNAPPIPAWQAWLFVGWVVITTVVYFGTMLGLL